MEKQEGISKGYLEEVKCIAGRTLQLEREPDTEE